MVHLSFDGRTMKVNLVLNRSGLPDARQFLLYFRDISAGFLAINVYFCKLGTQRYAISDMPTSEVYISVEGRIIIETTIRHQQEEFKRVETQVKNLHKLLET